MDLILVKEEDHPGLDSFHEYHFELKVHGETVCKLMAMEIVPGKVLDLTVLTKVSQMGKGYATEGLRRLTCWAAGKRFSEVRLTPISACREIVNPIAAKLYFSLEKSGNWSKSILGPLNL